ncbi:mannose-specific lectin [Cinnamomum micranthum f. kanehirae]|uniref:Mannose-specific lectin n=1 Tax=Cinnamomum micranthum f. kanehirae TaxID=337451 RepID=A0A3S3N1E7_9MAGN|nr:mannose-specific lectin [Cinnamomum micranthum f. kanehirae]
MGLTTWVLIGATWVILAMFVGAEDSLFNGERLLTNQFIENGPYKFIMQGDCNLVLYVKQDGKDKALWASNTQGHGDSCFLILQNNGNLVVFSGSDVVWSSSSTRGPNSYRLVVQTDGNVVIYGGATWATNTVQTKSNRKLYIEPSNV